MPTLRQYRRAMLDQSPLGPNTGLGAQFAVASLTTTTAVVSALAVGTLSSQAYAGKWLVRSDTSTTADRVRLCSAYTSSSGTLTHAGTNYGDTTATDEIIEVLAYRPELFDTGIQEALRKLRREDRYVIPTLRSTKRYWLDGMTWLTAPKEITRVCFSVSPVISNNRYMEKWNSINTSGLLRADHWTLSGASATYARSTTQVRRGQYSAAITRSGANATFSQTLSLLDTGVSGDSLRSQSVTAVAVVWSSVASQVRVQFLDGVNTNSSSYHTGGSGWEELTVTATVAAAATSLTLRVSVESDNTVCYVDECYLLADQSANRDDVRRDAFIERDIPYEIEQGAGTLALITPELGWAQQLVVYSSRAYPQFDATRIAAGTADGDSNDAPLIPVATGAIAKVYEDLSYQEGPDQARFAAMAAVWAKKFETLALGNSYMRDGNMGVPLPEAKWWPQAARRR